MIKPTLRNALSALLLVVANFSIVDARAVDLSWSPVVTYQSGPNTSLSGATMAFTVSIAQPTYTAATLYAFDFGAADFVPETVAVGVVSNFMVTISNAANPSYNGTFALSSISGETFYAIPNWNSQQLVSPLYPANQGSPNGFSIGSTGLAFYMDVTYSNSPIANPNVGDPIRASDFDGAWVSVSQIYLETGATSVFSVSPSTLVSVPEPTSVGAAIAWTLGFLIVARHFRRSSDLRVALQS
jgi:hypothetical protein